MTPLLRRVVVLAALFALELTLITLWLDNGELKGRQGLTAEIREWGPWILRGVVGFATLFAAFVFTRHKQTISATADEVARDPISRPALAAHFVVLGLFGILSSRLYAAGQGTSFTDLMAVAWLAAGLAAIALGAFAFIAYRHWAKVFAHTGYLWIYALVAVLLACVAGNFSRSLWPICTRITFSWVASMLGMLGPVVSDPARLTIGTRRFSVEIAPTCSGLEGVGLMLAFGLAWLVIFRRECRFPQALLLVPAGMAAVFVLNSVRITLLILIGNAGAERIAEGGFHSQAGWMIFNLVALGFSMAVRRTPWLTVRDSTRHRPAARHRLDSLEALYVLPLVAILAAGMIAHAATADFEWLYPLRFFAAAAVLFHFRKQYAMLEWRVGWQAPATGAVVFALWLAMDRGAPGGTEPMPAALAVASPAAMVLWLAVRALAASVTVPFAEELAFRGYLLRRIVSPAFDSVSFPNSGFRNLPWAAITISSVAFGLLHGDRWLAGALAGLCYALVYLRRGRVVEAAVAHGTTNALIALDVLVFHQWHLW